METNQEKQAFTLTCMFSPENPEKTQADTARTCKLHAESLQARYHRLPESEICCCPCLVEVTTTAAMSLTCREACCSVYSFLLLRSAFTCKDTSVQQLELYHLRMILSESGQSWRPTVSFAAPLRRRPAAPCCQRSRASKR